VQTTVAPAGAGDSAAASAATAKLRENKAKAKAPTPSEGVHATVDGFGFEVPAGSALAKQLAKAAKGLQAASAAFEGE